MKNRVRVVSGGSTHTYTAEGIKFAIDNKTTMLSVYDMNNIAIAVFRDWTKVEIVEVVV